MAIGNGGTRFARLENAAEISGPTPFFGGQPGVIASSPSKFAPENVQRYLAEREQFARMNASWRSDNPPKAPNKRKLGCRGEDYSEDCQRYLAKREPLGRRDTNTPSEDASQKKLHWHGGGEFMDASDALDLLHY